MFPSLFVESSDKNPNWLVTLTKKSMKLWTGEPCLEKGCQVFRNLKFNLFLLLSERTSSNRSVWTLIIPVVRTTHRCLWNNHKLQKRCLEQTLCWNKQVMWHEIKWSCTPTFLVSNLFWENLEKKVFCCFLRFAKINQKISSKRQNFGKPFTGFGYCGTNCEDISLLSENLTQSTSLKLKHHPQKATRRNEDRACSWVKNNSLLRWQRAIFSISSHCHSSLLCHTVFSVSFNWQSSTQQTPNPCVCWKLCWGESLARIFAGIQTTTAKAENKSTGVEERPKVSLFFWWKSAWN